MKKVALFLGAGAECSYGLPSGGKFALDIFRMNTSKDKDSLKNQLKNVDKQSPYSSWLPDDFENKKLTAFTKGQYDSIVKGSLENKRGLIINYLRHFDENVNVIVEGLYKQGLDIDKIFEEVLGVEIGKFNYGQEIKLNHMLGADMNEIFRTNYFSAFLRLIQIDNVSKEFNKNIKNITRTILELLIGSLGEELIHRLNDGVFEKSPDTIDLFDDLGAVFSLDYSNTGMRGLELLIENEEKNIFEITNNEEVILQFGMLILEDIFSRALDYQTLIDSNWRYIYNPKTDWGKFSKIIIFLYTVRRYINFQADKNKEKIAQGNGYYHDILKLEDDYELVAVGTTNYNSFIEDIIGKEVFYLNGSVKDYYDPYLNKIVTEKENEKKKHIIVPFLFTQSGIKPLTSVKMSARYVNLFNRLMEADIICIVGFGFNSDDGHINGMFRELIEDYNKTIVILHYTEENNNSIRNIKKEYQKKLRLDSVKGLNIILVDRNRNDIIRNNIWYRSLENEEAIDLEYPLAFTK
ncbi:SIR2 family protein [Clostridium sp. YIM B02551]|uniref:SIR2 family protein n=1 Tax=Clostridium sp. YIM B02551 TaxID=2910679 RepID=UPI001EEAA779|nr:SIR2 family protein [Clostridium sp. YIM B02551]